MIALCGFVVSMRSMNNLFSGLRMKLSGLLDWLYRQRKYIWLLWFVGIVAWVSYDLGGLAQSSQLVAAAGTPQGVVSVDDVDKKAQEVRGGRILILGANAARWVDTSGRTWEISSFSDEVTRGHLRRWRENGVEIVGGVNIAISPVEGDSKGVVFAHLMDVGLKILMLGIYILIGWVLWKVMGRGGARYNKMAKGMRPDVTVADVAGQEGPKRELVEVVDYLRDPERFKRAGARPPKGVLLYGPPGTGKTLLAKAVAGEAQASFIEQNAASFVRIFAGAGADSVRKLFAEARKSKPCVIFIDEIDAVGGSRSGMGSHDERVQCLNALLAEMDGFEDNTGLVVVAATNRLDALDDALVRPGRFDRKVHVPLPGREDREAILRLHARKMPHVTADIAHWADQSQGMSGADLAGLVNEAAIEAARAGQSEIGNREFARARDRILLGARDHGRKLSENDRKFVAHHELGHAVVRKYYGGRVEKISILPRATSLGVTISMQEEEKLLLTPDQVRQEIAVLMGGRAAEQVFFGTVTGGAADDMDRASRLAREAIHRYGFDGMGPYVPSHESLLRESEIRAAEWVKKGYEDAVEIVQAHRSGIERLAKALMEQEEIGEQLFNDAWDQGGEPVQIDPA